MTMPIGGQNLSVKGVDLLNKAVFNRMANLVKSYPSLLSRTVKTEVNSGDPKATVNEPFIRYDPEGSSSSRYAFETGEGNHKFWFGFDDTNADGVFDKNKEPWFFRAMLVEGAEDAPVHTNVYVRQNELDPQNNKNEAESSKPGGRVLSDFIADRDPKAKNSLSPEQVAMAKAMIAQVSGFNPIRYANPTDTLYGDGKLPLALKAEQDYKRFQPHSSRNERYNFAPITWDELANATVKTDESSLKEKFIRAVQDIMRSSTPGAGQAPDSEQKQFVKAFQTLDTGLIEWIKTHSTLRDSMSGTDDESTQRLNKAIERAKAATGFTDGMQNNKRIDAAEVNLINELNSSRYTKYLDLT